MDKKRNLIQQTLLLIVLCVFSIAGAARDLEDIKEAGVLRHIGVTYANFVTGSGDGLDVEIMQGFAAELGVRYAFVPSRWPTIFGYLTGRNARLGDQGVQWLDSVPVKGDVIANGLTILPWRREVVDFADPTFPSAVWLLARADSGVSPITPGDSVSSDIAMVKDAIAGITVLTQKNTCLDPALYRLSETRAKIRAAGNIQPDELAPAVLNNVAETTLLDVPDALIALERWPGNLKVIGPVSGPQEMAPAFRKDSPRLRDAFNKYLHKIRSNGSYDALIRKHYPNAFLYFPAFFSR